MLVSVSETMSYVLTLRLPPKSGVRSSETLPRPPVPTVAHLTPVASALSAVNI